MEALLTEGPYPVAFEVRADFYAYESGIYVHNGFSGKNDFDPMVVSDR